MEDRSRKDDPSENPSNAQVDVRRAVSGIGQAVSILQRLVDAEIPLVELTSTWALESQIGRDTPE
jgi:hypothetical protein